MTVHCYQRNLHAQASKSSCTRRARAARRRHLPALSSAAAAVLGFGAMSFAGVTVSTVSDATSTAAFPGTPAIQTIPGLPSSHVLVNEGFDDSRVEAQTFQPTSSFTLDQIQIYISGGSGDSGIPTCS